MLKDGGLHIVENKEIEGTIGYFIVHSVQLMQKIVVLLALLVISVSGFAQSKTVSASTKQMVYARDGGMCRCCGSSAQLEFDHIMPFSCGGGNQSDNIQLLCQACNRSKSNSCYCKIHQRKVGINCCSDHPKSTKPPPKAASQCTGTTQKGARCKNKTTNAHGRCHLH